MRALRHLSGDWAFTRFWRYGLTALLLLGPLALLLSMPPIALDPAYHGFADRREFFGIPNFLDVISSVPYLLAGIAGLQTCRRMEPGSTWPAWIVFFGGVALVGAGSAYYHWNPTNDTLLWDRLPMTLGFTGLFVAILTDYMGLRRAMLLLVPAVLAGLASVIYGHWYDDLRLYAWVQSLPLLAISAAFLLYRPGFTHRGYLLIALACYVFAKLAELYDRQVFAFTAGIVSGHTVKHLLAALGICAIVVMLKQRTPIHAGTPR